MHAKARKILLTASLVLVSGAVARAQQMDAIGALLQRSDAQGVTLTDTLPSYLTLTGIGVNSSGGATGWRR